jgi:hypothetical protein
MIRISQIYIEGNEHEALDLSRDVQIEFLDIKGAATRPLFQYLAASDSGLARSKGNGRGLGRSGQENREK